PCVLMLVAWRSPRLMPPWVGLSAMLPQYAAGRMMEPPTCVPIAAGSIRAATAAAEPDEEPPGGRARSDGLGVGPGGGPASSAGPVLPTTTAPACRSAHTAALSRFGKLSRYAAQPIWVGMSFVSSRSLMPMGRPSIGERGRPSFQRLVLSSA